MAAPLCLAVCACDDRPSTAPQGQAPTPATSASALTLTKRSARCPTYPCTQCHEHTPGRSDPTERKLEQFHAARPEVNHGALEGWCYRCHHQANLDELVLPDGRTVSFDDSHEQCGACHGDKMADWRDGIHGHTIGHWNGPRVTSACADCHNPHQPRFPSMIAEPAPPRPRTVTAASSREGS